MEQQKQSPPSAPVFTEEVKSDEGGPDLYLIVMCAIGISLSAAVIIVDSWLAEIMRPVDTCHDMVDPWVGCGLAFSVLFGLAFIVLLARSGISRSPFWTATPIRCGYSIAFILLFLIYLIITIVSSFLISFGTTLPCYTCDVTGLKGIHGEIKLERSKDGITTIRAVSLEDALFGQGFVHAQDRLAQLVVQRWAGRGELSSRVGSAGLDYDKLQRTMNLKGAAKRMCQSADANATRLLNSYVGGINAYIDSKDLHIPFDLAFLGTQTLIADIPDKFTIEDACLSMVQLQLSLSANCDDEEFRWKQYAKNGFGYDDIEKKKPEIFHIQKYEAASITTWNDIVQYGPGERMLIPPEVAAAQEQSNRDTERLLMNTMIPQWVSTDKKASKRTSHSNKFKAQQNENGDSPTSEKASSAKKASGRTVIDFSDMLESMMRPHLQGSNAWVTHVPGKLPLVANDPHLPLTLPSVWYYQRLLIGSSFSALGATHPGMPGIVIGSTSYVSFGVTLSLTDICDYFVLTPDPNDANAYLHNGTSKKYTTRTEIIKVKNEADVTLQVRESLYGPLMNGLKDTKWSIPMAMWHGALQTDGGMSLSGILSTLTSRTVEEFDELVLRRVLSPGLSVCFGDVQGGYAWAMTGYHPIRAPGHTGRYPIPGNGSFDPVGMIPMADLPRKIVPASVARDKFDFIVAANQKVHPQGYKYFLGYDYEPTYRANRLQTGFRALNSTVKLIDTVESEKLQTNSISNAWVFDFRPLFQNMSTLNVDVVNAWDGTLSPDSKHGAKFGAFLEALPGTSRNHMLEKFFFCQDPKNIAAVEAAWRTASSSSSSWGDTQGFLNIPNLVVSSSPLKCLGHRTSNGKVGGDGSSTNVLSVWDGDDLSTQWAPSVRQIMSVGNGTIRFAWPGGNSENGFSTFYANFLAKYLKGNYETLVVNASDSVMYSSVLKP
eukprot:PhF_6_TR35356/c0_g1_i1/m.51313/K01434/E3.5.1.11; penicillin amidase